MKGCLRLVFCKVEVEYEINCINFKSVGGGSTIVLIRRIVYRENYLYILGNEGGMIVPCR